MKYLILLVGIYLIYRYRTQQRQQVNAGQTKEPLDHQTSKHQVKDDEADYIDYEEVE